MKKLMTQKIAKWAAKQNIPPGSLEEALSELIEGNFEVNLGGNIYKQRIRFAGQGKRGSGRIEIRS